MNYNKLLIFTALIDSIKKNIDLAVQAAQNTYGDATHEDNKAENKYDTRALEASYLAGAQAERVHDLKIILNKIQQIKIINFNHNSFIALTCLIRLVSDHKNFLVLLLPVGGGQNFTFDNESIRVVTPESPMGQMLLGKMLSDTVSLNGVEYSISNIY